MTENEAIGLPVDEELKQCYLDFYAEWIDIKYEQFGRIQRLPDKIWDFATENKRFKIIPDKFYASQDIVSYHQREAVNVRTAWRLLCNGESNPYRYLESACAWFTLLERCLARQGQTKTGDDFKDRHLSLSINQDQHNILHEIELCLDPAIIGLVATAERVAHVIVRTFNTLFPEHNAIYCYVDRATDPEKIIEQTVPPDIKTGQVYQTLVKTNAEGRLDPLIKLLQFFVSSEFEDLRRYRNDYVHGFGQKVGYPDQELQMLHKYVDIKYKQAKPKDKPVHMIEFPFMGVSEQDWTHKDLLSLTLKVWNEMVDVITKIFDVLQDIYVED